MTKHGGDGSIMVRHGASFDEAPLKLEPPYLHIGEDVEHAFVEFSNATDAVFSNDHVYVMLVGGEHCARQCGSDAVGGGVAEEGGCAPRLDKGDDAEARRVEGILLSPRLSTAHSNV